MPTAVSNYINSNFGDTTGLERVPSKSLNQDDFLKLLVTQISAQDPLNPKADLDMAAQMAQFTALEQSRNMASDMATMSSNIASLLAEQQVLQANGLLGREVTLVTGQNTTTTGTVSGVNFVSGQPRITVDGTDYGLDKVLTISPAAVAATETEGSLP